MFLQRRFPILLALTLLAGCYDDKIAVDSSPAGIDAAQDASITLVGAPATEVDEDGNYYFQPTVAQTGLGTVTYSVTGKPNWMNFDSSTGALTGTPTATDVGTTSEVTITATSSSLSGSVGPYTVKVRHKGRSGGTNNPPTISGTPAASVSVGSTYRFAPSATDPNGDTLRFAISNMPAWASFSTNTGVLTGTPTGTDVGTFASIGIRVTDGIASTSLPVFSIQVQAVNRAPTIAGTPATSVTAGAAYQFAPSATDADGDVLTFSITNKPLWASFNTATGALTGTPAASQAGNYPGIAIGVSDGNATATLATFSIQVSAVVAPTNSAPTISGSAATTVAAGASYTFTPTASDANSDPLTFSVQNKPVWATFNSSNGALAGTPTSAQVGSYANIVIAVSDGKVSTALPAFGIQVTSVNRAPTIVGTPPTSVVTGQNYSFTPTVADADGDIVTFSILNKPAWANFSITTGAVTGTPTATQAGNYANIGISVSDGKASTSLPAFAINVSAPSTGTATMNWTAPTKNSDGTSLTNLAGYRVAYGNNLNSLTQLADIPNATATTYTISNLAGGTWYFTIRSYNTLGEESAPTNAVSITL